MQCPPEFVQEVNGELVCDTSAAFGGGRTATLDDAFAESNYVPMDEDTYENTEEWSNLQQQLAESGLENKTLDGSVLYGCFQEDEEGNNTHYPMYNSTFQQGGSKYLCQKCPPGTTGGIVDKGGQLWQTCTVTDDSAACGGKRRQKASITVDPNVPFYPQLGVECANATETGAVATGTGSDVVPVTKTERDRVLHALRLYYSEPRADLRLLTLAQIVQYEPDSTRFDCELHYFKVTKKKQSQIMVSYPSITLSSPSINADIDIAGSPIDIEGVKEACIENGGRLSCDQALDPGQYTFIEEPHFTTVAGCLPHRLVDVEDKVSDDTLPIRVWFSSNIQQYYQDLYGVGPLTIRIEKAYAEKDNVWELEITRKGIPQEDGISSHDRVKDHIRVKVTEGYYNRWQIDRFSEIISIADSDLFECLYPLYRMEKRFDRMGEKFEEVGDKIVEGMEDFGDDVAKGADDFAKKAGLDKIGEDIIRGAEDFVEDAGLDKIGEDIAKGAEDFAKDTGLDKLGDDIAKGAEKFGEEAEGFFESAGRDLMRLFSSPPKAPSKPPPRPSRPSPPISAPTSSTSPVTDTIVDAFDGISTSFVEFFTPGPPTPPQTPPPRRAPVPPKEPAYSVSPIVPSSPPPSTPAWPLLPAPVEESDEDVPIEEETETPMPIEEPGTPIEEPETPIEEPETPIEEPESPAVVEDPCQKEPQCYRLDTSKGWTQEGEKGVGVGHYTRVRCYRKDNCQDDGPVHSGSGNCYKWARGKDCRHVGWGKQKYQKKT